MTASLQTAIDEITAIAAQVFTGVPGLVVKWDGIDEMKPPSGESNWVYVTIRHDDGFQASLSGPVDGKKRWRAPGILTVQCFWLRTDTGIMGARALASLVQKAYRGRATASGVWFRNPSIREVGVDSSWYQVNFTVSFEYDEVE